jgi:hypothetical protein
MVFMIAVLARLRLESRCCKEVDAGYLLGEIGFEVMKRWEDTTFGGPALEDFAPLVDIKEVVFK